MLVWSRTVDKRGLRFWLASMCGAGDVRRSPRVPHNRATIQRQESRGSILAVRSARVIRLDLAGYSPLMSCMLTYWVEFQRGTDSVGFHDGHSRDGDKGDRAYERDDRWVMAPLCCGCASSCKNLLPIATNFKSSIVALHVPSQVALNVSLRHFTTLSLWIK